MDAEADRRTDPGKHATNAERTSERELTVTRTFNAPARLVFEAWTQAELFRQWWVPKSFDINLESCEMDVRVGGGYRLVFTAGDSEPMDFVGRYLEVVPASRLVWTNEETDDGAITIVTFEEEDGKTRLVMRDVYPTKEALESAVASGSTCGTSETFAQLEELLAVRGGGRA